MNANTAEVHHQQAQSISSIGVVTRIDVHLVAGAIVVLLAMRCAGHAERIRSNSTSMQSEQRQLLAAQRSNEIAQTAYYTEQTAKLKEKAPQMTFWENVSENPTSAISVSAALIAAIMALVSFGFNYRATLKNQRDIQFYEALKRFGDKDSASMRCSAAALLADLGLTRSYTTTAFNQLATSLMLEDNRAVLHSITDAIKALFPCCSDYAGKKLMEVNIKIQEDLVDYLGQMQGLLCSQDAEYSSIASALSNLPKSTVVTLTAGDPDMFRCGSEFGRRTSSATLPDKRPELLIDVERKVSIIVERLAANVRVLSAALKGSVKTPAALVKVFLVEGALNNAVLKGISMTKSQFEKASLHSASLADAAISECSFNRAELMNADLSGSQVTNSDMSHADLSGVDLRGASLTCVKVSEANLTGAKIDGRTKFAKVNWWTANYEPVSDVKLLNFLYDNFGDGLPVDLSEVHGSIREFVSSKRGEIAGTSAPISTESKP